MAFSNAVNLFPLSAPVLFSVLASLLEFENAQKLAHLSERLLPFAQEFLGSEKSLKTPKRSILFGTLFIFFSAGLNFFFS